MYQFESKVRYSEADEDGYLSLTGLMNYLQDCVLFHSEACGGGIEWLAERDRAWLLSGWQIEIYRRPRFLEQIRVITRPYAFQGVLGYRYFEIRSEEGELLVFANSVWCYVQPSVMRPVKVTDEDTAPYRPLDDPPASMAERKIRTETGGSVKEAITVRREHLDTNHHVNNGSYVEMAADYLPENCRIGRICAEYRNQARLGDCMIPTVAEKEGSIAVTLSDGAKKVYAVVLFDIERKQTGT